MRQGNIFGLMWLDALVLGQPCLRIVIGPMFVDQLEDLVVREFIALVVSSILITRSEVRIITTHPVICRYKILLLKSKGLQLPGCGGSIMVSQRGVIVHAVIARVAFWPLCVLILEVLPCVRCWRDQWRFLEPYTTQVKWFHVMVLYYWRQNLSLGPSCCRHEALTVVGISFTESLVVSCESHQLRVKQVTVIDMAVSHTVSIFSKYILRYFGDLRQEFVSGCLRKTGQETGLMALLVVLA